MKNFWLGVLATLVALAGGIFAYLSLGLAEVRGDLPGSRVESYLMSTAVHASVRRHAPEIPNPVPATDENLIAGGKIYHNECSGCHGSPGSAEDDGDVLYPPIPQLPKVGTEYTEAQIFWVAKHGIRRAGMFANGKWDSDEHLWTVAAYVKRMNALPDPVKEALEPKQTAEADSKDSSKQK
jgi:mono/diheme cytochrome c family protein